MGSGSQVICMQTEKIWKWWTASYWSSSRLVYIYCSQHSWCSSMRLEADQTFCLSSSFNMIFLLWWKESVGKGFQLSSWSGWVKFCFGCLSFFFLFFFSLFGLIWALHLYLLQDTFLGDICGVLAPQQTVWVVDFLSYCHDLPCGDIVSQFWGIFTVV